MTDEKYEKAKESKAVKKISLHELDLVLMHHRQLADFSKARLRESDFHNAQIFNTNFTNAHLSAVVLNGAKLKNVNFQGAHLGPECYQDMMVLLD